jgi:hypothetical protein
VSTTITHTDEATSEAIIENATDVAWGLLGERSENTKHRARVFAIMVSALHREGWTGRATHDILGCAMGGYTWEELKAAERAAGAITTPWFQLEKIELRAQPTDDEKETYKNAIEAGKVLRRLLRQNAPTQPGMPAPGGDTLSLDGAPRAPQWLCEGVLARGRTHMLSGAWGSAKSLFREELMAASLLQRPFLGRDVPVLNWLVIDGENAREDVETRWHALGLRGEHLARVRYIGRERSIKLGEDDWNLWLRSAVEDFRPDVLVIDSAMRCCVGTLSNEDATKLYDELFVPLVDRFDLALLFTHHHRKSGGTGNLADAALGGTQFSGQADLTLTLAKTKNQKITPRADGCFDTVSSFAARFPKSGRGSYLTVDEREYFEVRGVLGADKALHSLRLDRPQAEPTLDERLLAELGDGPLGRGALADALAVNQTGSPFRTALSRLLDSHTIEKNDDKLYVLVDA